jgi:hypothetical protein
VTDDIRAACDAVLLGHLPPSLRASLDRLLAAGEHPADILARVRRAAARAGSNGLTAAAVEAYLERAARPA